MPSSAYRKGYNFEQRIRRILEEHEFFVVRSAGSKGIFDIIAIRNGLVLGVQCKVNGKLSKKERAQAISIAQIYGITPILAYRVGKKVFYKDLASEVVTDDLRVLLNSGE